MPAGVMAEIADMVVGMLSEDMPRPATLGADTLVSVLAVYVVTNLRGPHAETAAMQLAHIWNGGRRWGGNYWYPSYGYSRVGYYGLGYGYPYYGSGYYGYRYGGYYPYLRKLGILPLPLRILAVRELQLRVLRSSHH